MKINDNSKLTLMKLLFQLYDKISTRVPTPYRPPQTDAIQRAREAEEVLRGFERSGGRNVDRSDVRELLEILNQPHFKVRKNI